MTPINDTKLVFVPLAGKVKQQDSLTLIAKGTFQLTPNAMVTLCDANDQHAVTGDEYLGNDKNNGLSYDADFAYFKPQTDVLLIGACHTPGRKAQPQCRVSFGVGDFIKSLLVLGNRQWLGGISGGRTTQPETFIKMPLGYQYSALYNKYAEQQTSWSLRNTINEQLPLPNVQPIDFNHAFTSSVSYEPHGFSPIHRLWEQRASKMGYYKGNYLGDYWPWFPKDFDWRYFNAAPEDQQLHGYLRGDEKLYFENLHAQHAQYHSQLPGFRLRCFLNEAQHHLHNYREIQMNLDTLWVDIENEKLVLVWRGVANVKSQDYEEIQQAQLILEKLSDSPKPVDGYKDKLLDSIFTEEVIDTTIVQPRKNIDNCSNDNETTLLKHPKLKSPTSLSSAQSEEAFGEMDADLQNQINKALNQARNAITATGQDPGLVDQLMNTQDPNTVLASMFAALGVDLTQGEKIMRQSREKTAQMLQEQGGDAEEYLAMFDEQETIELTTEKTVFDKTTIQQQARQGVSFSGQDFSGMDLSYISLVGADFSNATLTGANFQSSDLSKADFSGATLSGATLNQAVLVGAVLPEADLHGAKLQASDLTQADISGANFSDCDLSKATLNNVTANHGRFCRATLTDAAMAKAQLRSANFDSARLDNANFQGAVLVEASFNYVSGNQVNLEKADLTELKASEHCVLRQSNLTYVNGSEAIFTGADLSGSKLNNSKFPRALFTDATLVETDLSFCDCTKANFRKADMMKINARKSNFFQAILERSDLTKADFSDSNLFEVEFLGAIIAKAKFLSANLNNTKLAQLKKIQ
ncbi:MAG: DUF2169 domain-containing protein [Gammaproteobacteria bacterium]|nr:DUF2169 domain-containing protein [Gammaproteobacteria bacterium]